MSFKSNSMLAAALVFAALSASAQYTLIPYSGAMVADAESSYDANRMPIYAINGAGLDPETETKHVKEHAGTMWMGEPGAPNFAKWFRVDLGSVHPLGGIKIWNFNMNNGSSFSFRGVKDIDIYVSTSAATGATPDFNDTAVWTRVLANVQVSNAGGIDNYLGEPIINVPTVPARWVAFKINSVHDNTIASNGGFCGLSEVRFYTAGEPSPVINSLDVSATSVGFAGEFLFTGSANPIPLTAHYGTSNGGTSAGAWAASELQGSYGVEPFSGEISGLTADTGYYLALAAINDAGLVGWTQPSAAFMTAPVAIDPVADAYETEQNVSITFRRPPTTANVPITAAYTVSGSAQAGVDYAAMSGKVFFSNTVSEVTQMLQIFDNDILDGERTITITIQPGNYINGGARTFNILDNEGVSSDIAWTGQAYDNNWHNAANWNPARVPLVIDNVHFTSSGAYVNNTITLASPAQVNSLNIDAASIAIHIGETEGPALTTHRITRADSAVEQYIDAPLAIPSPATWDITGSSPLTFRGKITSNDHTVTKTGSGTARISATNTGLTGLFIAREGLVRLNANTALNANVEVGGGDNPATILMDTRNAIRNGRTVFARTNGVFNCQGNVFDYGDINVWRAEHGGSLAISSSFATFYEVNGAYITSGYGDPGWDQRITSLANANTSIVNLSIKTKDENNHHFDFIVADGDAPVDLIYESTIRSDYNFTTPLDIRKSGAGVLRVTKNQPSLKRAAFRVNAGTLLADNPDGSATGYASCIATGSATIGGAGHIASLTNSSIVRAEGSSIVSPGTIDDETGEHIIGELTIGSETWESSMTFTGSSRLRIHLSDYTKHDTLRIHGPLNLAATTTLELIPPSDGKMRGGRHTLATFTSLTGAAAIEPYAPLPRGWRLEVAPTEIQLIVPPLGTVVMVR